MTTDIVDVKAALIERLTELPLPTLRADLFIEFEPDYSNPAHSMNLLNSSRDPVLMIA
jgi:hypothetical protein